MPKRGYFVISDITGYTAFMTGSELEHAQDILKSLFDTLLDSLKPPLVISNFQGDAVLTYAEDQSVGIGQNMLELLENIYSDFAQKSEAMQRNTTCTCRACANISKLDLKIFVHYGEYVMQDMRGKAELSGPDVIVAHRMMKNNVREQTGLHAYILFSEAAVNQLGLQEYTCEMYSHAETYEHIGNVNMFVYCLKTMWEQEREKRRQFVKPEEAWFTVEVDMPHAPITIWRCLTEPELRTKITEVHNFALTEVKHGRVVPGTTYHCSHGGSTTTDFLILDWKPFEYMTEVVSGMPFGVRGTITTRLSSLPDGRTHVVWLFSPLTGTGLSKLASYVVRPVFKSFLRKTYERIGEMMNQHTFETVN